MDTPQTPTKTTMAEDKPLNPKFPSSRKNIPIEKLIELRKRGMTIDEIGKIVGCNKVNVYNRLKALNDDIEGIGEFKKHKDDVILLKQSRLINALTDSQIEKMAPRDKVLAFGILEDKLERRAQANKPNLSINLRISPEQLKLMAEEMLARSGSPTIDITPTNQLIDNETETEVNVDISTT